MTAKLIDGKAIAAAIQAQIKQEVESLKTKPGIIPGLATVLVGENPASKAYIASKQKMCLELGLNSIGHQPDANISQDELLQLVRSLAVDKNVHGILVQLPLPAHIDAETIL